jgi:hypothetical protein
LEGNLFAKVDEAFDLRLESWKVKIEEGVTTKSEVVVLDDDVVEVAPPKAKKRPRASDKTTLPTFSKKQKVGSVGTQGDKRVPPPPPASRKNKAQESLFTDDEDAAGDETTARDKGKGKEKAGAGLEKDKEVDDGSVVRRGHALSALGMFLASFTHSLLLPGWLLTLFLL